MTNKERAALAVAALKTNIPTPSVPFPTKIPCSF